MGLDVIIFITPILLYVGLYVYGVKSEDPKARAFRREFIFWLIGLCILNFIMSLIIEIFPGASGIIALIYSAVIAYPTAQVVTRRCQDAGLSRTEAYLFLVPILNLILFIVLIFKGSSPLNPDSPTYGRVEIKK